jgi:molecular chaperone DnaJ
MTESDYYKVLGVAEDASQEDIRKAYRKLAKQHHPDRHGGSKAAEEKFKEISDAYGVLGDPQKRNQYDQLRRAGMSGGAFGGMGFDFGGAGPRQAWRGTGGFDFGGEGGLGDMGDLFSRIFGGAQRSRRRPAARRGHDVESSVTIPFQTAVRGGKVSISIPRDKTCPSCDGSGAAKGSRVDPCPQCNGMGEVLSGQGGFSVARPCPTCFGRGQIIERPCGRCGGSGSVEETSRLEVNIPKGIRDGQKIRLAGMGRPGAGGAPAGDLRLEINVEPHPEFERKGRDIHSKVSVSMADAALGTKIDVRTLQGTVSVSVPAGSQPGRRLRIPGYGMETSDGRKGDHFVEIQVTIPRKLSDEQRRLLEQLRKAPAAT